ncbi:hypothetical protein QUA13_19700 [Microcoleus sp. S28C3]
MDAGVRWCALVCAGVRWCAIEHFVLLFVEEAQPLLPTNSEFSVCGE